MLFHSKILLQQTEQNIQLTVFTLCCPKKFGGGEGLKGLDEVDNSPC